jgi:hypothetical protein
MSEMDAISSPDGTCREARYSWREWAGGELVTEPVDIVLA